MSRKKRREKKSRAKKAHAEEKKKVLSIAPTLDPEYDPEYEVEDYVKTFWVYNKDTVNLQPLKRQVTKAFNRFEYQIKKKYAEFFTLVFEKRNTDGDHAVSELITPEECGHMADLAGHQIEVEITFKGKKILILTQLQLLARCHHLTGTIKVEKKFHELDVIDKNIFWLNVVAEKFGGCLFDVRCETDQVPALAAIVINEGHHPCLTTQVVTHPMREPLEIESMLLGGEENGILS